MKIIKKAYEIIVKMNNSRKQSLRVSQTIDLIDSCFDSAIEHLVSVDRLNARICAGTGEYIYRKKSKELGLTGASAQIKDRLTDAYFGRLSKIRGELYI